jgi:poly(A) polymerase
VSATTTPRISTTPRIVARPDHAISRRNIAHGALRVLYRLHRAGFEACLVGGCVRDLLLSRKPKDFDIVTDAYPERVRRLFRHARIIGRRFRLVHVVYPDGVIEVSTFRGDPDPGRQRRRPGELLVTSDNTYGTPEEDAFRRDFTVNALFYRISDFAVVDYVGGLRDLDQRILRTIGDPDVRLPEDPVRMMRACELAGRLDFRIDRRTEEAIRLHAREIVKASPARLTEELLELLACGRSYPAFERMAELGLLEQLFPQAGPLLLAGRGRGELSDLLPTLDRWTQEGRQPGDAGLLAVVLAPVVIEQRSLLERRHRNPTRRELQRVIEDAVIGLSERFALSRARSHQLYHLLETFQRLCEPMPEDDEVWRIAVRPSFPEALELFELLSEATGAAREETEAWRRAAREAAHRPAPEASVASRRRRRRRRR